jgi:hypothetical protein
MISGAEYDFAEQQNSGADILSQRHRFDSWPTAAFRRLQVVVVVLPRQDAPVGLLPREITKPRQERTTVENGRR